MLKIEKVYSPIYDKQLAISKNLNKSKVWDEAYKEDEIEELNGGLHCYTIKFDGLKPIHTLKHEKIR